ncbi:DUF2793 domain-containing protein [uncultured Sphingomonas sp.]|uniref:DUF2793 domain-containing protein n=1 Tax=uncultured Sphingomonas sp. TaxID=158754 RepID=UPI00343DD7EB
MTDTTARLALPMIVPGQAQKEMTHNEALALLAIAVQAQVTAVGTNVPPTDPMLGECWVVGPAPTGAWVGQADAVAGWTGGGWRFVPAHPGFTVGVAYTGRRARFSDQGWESETAPAAVVAPSGGDVIDTQARTAITQLLTALRGLKLLPE